MLEGKSIDWDKVDNILSIHSYQKNRTKLEIANAKIRAFMKGKNVVLVVPNPNTNEKNKPFVRINAEDVWSRNKYIMKQNSQISYK